MSKELTDIIIIGATITALSGLLWIIKQYHESIYPIKWWHYVGGKEKPLTPYQQTHKNTSIQFLERVVNHRKTSLLELHKAGYLSWDEYTILYNWLIQWKDDKLKLLENNDYLCM